ncbi:MAG: hypothetical protein LUE20_01985 [Oscillospiraceae bacterium]|nr:hypothetical protein [Oscillospiraceae bacterium]
MRTIKPNCGGSKTTPDSTGTVYCGVCGAKNYYKNQVCVNCGHVLNH